jgi:hypothetical protein
VLGFGRFDPSICSLGRWNQSVLHSRWIVHPWLSSTD